MEVVLMERIEKLGIMGDIVTVKDGFARNFLLPQGKALRATKANMESLVATHAAGSPQSGTAQRSRSSGYPYG